MRTLADILAFAFSCGSGGHFVSGDEHAARADAWIARHPPARDVTAQAGLLLRGSPAFARAFVSGQRTYYGCREALAQRRYPALDAYINAPFNGDDSTMPDKMQQFIPGIVPGQRLFYHVAASGTVEGHWLVPGTHGPRSYGPATDHPLGTGPEPGWYDGEGNRLPRDPREVAP